MRDEFPPLTLVINDPDGGRQASKLYRTSIALLPAHDGVPRSRWERGLVHNE